MFVPPNESAAWIGVAIGDGILDASRWLSGDVLNAYLALPTTAARRPAERIGEDARMRAPQRDVFSLPRMHALLPVRVGDYTDFYASIHHATNVGKLFRPDNPLLAELQARAASPTTAARRRSS